ncbi:MAG: hypothetical protein ISS35_10080 [Kiritimatiellae bacterium]|nr:hypothetical protein [Kiritimatiellia bacterium]
MVRGALLPLPSRPSVPIVQNYIIGFIPEVYPDYDLPAVSATQSLQAGEAAAG